MWSRQWVQIWHHLFKSLSSSFPPAGGAGATDIRERLFFYHDEDHNSNLMAALPSCGIMGPDLVVRLPTALVAWLRPDMSCQQGAPEATFGRRRGSRSSAGTKCGEIIAGVHGEGNVPLSVVPLLTAQRIIIHSKRGATTQTGPTIIEIRAARRSVYETVRSPRPAPIFESNHINNGCGFIIFSLSLWTHNREHSSFYSNSFPEQKVKHDASRIKYQRR